MSMKSSDARSFRLSQSVNLETTMAKRQNTAPLDVFAEGMPSVIRNPVILNWYLPVGVNPLEKKKIMCRALAAAGFTYPSVTNASDEGSQHFVFECEWADGDV